MSDDLSQQCAAWVLDTNILIKRTLDTEMRKRNAAILSMQQFRTLIIIKRGNGVSLSTVSEHLGATISSASKLVDGMVELGLVTRETAPDDRRKLVLAATEAGTAAVDSMHNEALACLAEKLASLTTSECAMIKLAMDLLQTLFVQARTT